MSEPITPVQKKVLQLKALLGDNAAKDVLDKASEKETLAQAAGVEFKEKKTVTTKAEEAAKPTSLAALLAQIEDGLEAGTITNDLEESDEVAEPVESKEADEAQVIALKALIGEVLDEKLAKLVEAAKPAETVKEAAKPDPKIAELELKAKEAKDQLATVEKALAELLGEQPKSAPFRASQSDSTVVKEANKQAPHAGTDGIDSFITDFVMAGKTPAVQP